MTQPPDQPQPWWQQSTNAQPAPDGWQPERQPEAGHWQRGSQESVAGAYPGQWQPQSGGSPTGAQPTPGHWQPALPLPGTSPPGQFDSRFQPSQYGGLGAFRADVEPKRKRSKKPLIFACLGVLVLAGAAVAALLLGAFSGDTLEQKSLQDGVSKILNEDYGENDVRNTQCPANEKIKAGTTFDCSVQIGGQPKKVAVRVLNDKPEYEVGAPH